ncbi:isopentenyl-diphosphate delta isomerase [Anaeramoeba flamelloides]|uniref:isopentenyl-diphosphate Delta-isomerase n=1 Tax=Anaeramoeba flamelloides TaxID=1746091 RepID=A0AAV7ZSA3_9EUKA|nr:isopentenyl-diphosphate delta isomerase [Anaeramoeba flamelloides]
MSQQDDEEQLEFMKSEQLILVNEKDEEIGSNSKLVCHTDNLLHRAFSVFLFNSSNQLLIQKRSSFKITFPLIWANTCCSHPLHNEKELVEENAVGVKRAAIRKLNQELGINPQDLSVEDFVFLTRFHYNAKYTEKLSEHEIDYILFLHKDLELDINPNEIDSVKYVTQEQLKEMLKNDKISPWMRIICQSYLFPWWDKLINGATTSKEFISTEEQKKIEKLQN